MGLTLLCLALPSYGSVHAEELDLPDGFVFPEAAEEPAPQYPEAALEADVESDVLFELELDAEGGIVSARVIELTYYSWDEDGEVSEEIIELEDDVYGFVDAATTALLSHVFRPAMLPSSDGELVGVPIELLWEISFVIDEVEIEVELPLAEDDLWIGVGPVVVEPGGRVNVVGSLRVFGDGASIAGAELRLLDGSGLEVAAAQADADGLFAFSGVPAGSWRLEAAVEGATAEPSLFELLDGERVEIQILAIAEDDSSEAQLLVTRTVATAPPPAVTRRTLRVSEIQRLPGNGGDPIRAVQNLPGVARASFGSGALIVRGSSPQDTGFLIDGAPIPTLYHFGGLRSVFPAEILEAIDFYPGGFGAQHGRRTGGYLSARTRQPRSDGYHGFVDVNVIDAGFLVEGPISEKLSFSVSGRRSYIDAILLPLASALELQFTTAPRYYDYQARLQYEPSSAHRISLMFYGSDDLIDFLLEDERDLPPSQRGGIRALSRFNAALLRYDARLTDNLTNELRLQLSKADIEMNLGEDISLNIGTLTYFLRDTLSYEVNDQFTLRGGVDLELIPADVSVRAPQMPREGEIIGDFNEMERHDVSSSVTIYEPSLFVETEIQATDRLLIVPGARLEWYRQPGRWAADGRIFGRYEFNEQLALKAAFGSYHQAPQIQEMDSTRTFGNPDLELERAFHYVGGVETEFLPGLEVNVELFWKDLQNFVASTDEVVTVDGGVRPLLFDNAAVGRVYGAELLLRYSSDEHPFSGWLSWTINRSQRRDRPDAEWRLFDHDQPNILTAVASWSLPKDWSLAGRFRLVSGNPYTPMDGSVYNASSGSYLPTYGAINSSRMPVFHQLDLRVDKRWQFQAWRLAAYLDLQNALNRANVETFAYSYDFSERAPISGLPLIPSFGLRAEW